MAKAAYLAWRKASTRWTLGGDILTVFIPITWKRRGGQKVIIAPDGGDAWMPAKPRPDETLIRALARAHRWNRMLETGKFRSIAEIANAEKIDRSFVSRLLDLTLLAPDIQEAILEGRQPKGMQLEELTRVIPSRWEKQWELLLPCAIMYHNKRLRAGPVRGAKVRARRSSMSWFGLQKSRISADL